MSEKIVLVNVIDKGRSGMEPELPINHLHLSYSLRQNGYTPAIYSVNRESLDELVDKINDLTGKNIDPIFDKPRLGEIKHSFANIDLIKKELNYSPSVSFLNGIDLTLTYQGN